MRRPLLLVPALLLGAACADTANAPDLAPSRAQGTLPASDGGARGLTVLNWNLYLGGDPFSVVRPSPLPIPVRVALVWQAVQQSNFPERAGAIARAIAEKNPDVLTLQEVPLYRIDPLGDAAVGGTNPATVVALDFIQVLRDSLAARGLTYDVASVGVASDIEAPMLVSQSPLRLMDLRYTDRDAVLVRRGVATSDPRSGVYAARLTLPLGPSMVSALRGWASANVTVGGITWRVVSTHLETESNAATQEAQAAELATVLATETRPTILAGDLNSDGDRTGTSSYAQLVDGAGFADAWTEANPKLLGNTSSLPIDILFSAPQLRRRIDFILVRQHARANASAGILGGVHAEVIGEEPADRTASGRWPSDHAGVVALLRSPASLGKR